MSARSLLPCMMLVALLAGAAGALAQAAPQRFALSDTRMASTPESRNTLKYLASCALDAQAVLTASHDGVAYEFPGGLALAPHWHARAMTDEEQRWVSACMLARTNRFGTRVELSMRSPFPTKAQALSTEPGEEAAYPLEEASYFGNLFTANPTAYVCGPKHSAATRALLVAQHRVCALPLSGKDGKGATDCHMLHVGVCSAEAFQRDGLTYRQAVTVYLPAQAPPLLAPPPWPSRPAPP